MKKLIRTTVFSVLLLSYSFGQHQQIESKVQNDSQKNREFITSVRLPKNLPHQLNIPITFKGQLLTLELQKNQVYGENTRFLIEDPQGHLVEVDKGFERTYFGYVAEHPEFWVNAALTDNGLIASVFRPGQETMKISPTLKNSTQHQIRFEKDNQIQELDRGPEVAGMHLYRHEETLLPDQNLQIGSNYEIKSSVKVPVTQNSNKDHVTITRKRIDAIASNQNMVSNATLPPTTVMDVYEYEVGVEIGSRAFYEGEYNGDLAFAQRIAQGIIGNLDRRFYHSAGIKSRLGTVIIRTDAANDPLRDLVNDTGAGNNASASLRAFRDYWNNNPAEVGNSHDLAVYHVFHAPSGRAFLNGAASSNGYATSGGMGATSWADGTAAHEVGHLWNLFHVNRNRIFYEARPRNGRGATKAGGNDFFISIMHGDGNHNIGRLATNEAQIALASRNGKRSRGNLLTNPPAVRPFGVYDEVELFSNAADIIIDVVRNDYDVNNDVLDVRLLDAVSNQGGTIELSEGTGPGGRNELRYTPPASGITGRDFFHYTVFDTTGASDFGAVYISQVICNPGDPCNYDQDGDTIADDDDNCPTVANTDQADADGDGIGDVCDDNPIDCEGTNRVIPEYNIDGTWFSGENTLEVNEGTQIILSGLPNSASYTITNPAGDTSGDNLRLGAIGTSNIGTYTVTNQLGCSTTITIVLVIRDADDDGIPDAEDNCSETANADQADIDGDGIGDACDTDNDNDGVDDAQDNCPETANADQADTDGDGIGDACDTDNDNDGVDDGQDNCPETSNADQADSDGDGVGDTCDTDNDNDGVDDAQDNCPETANANQADIDGDGIGDACDTDNDNDGVDDAQDNCPDTSNADQTDTDGDGIGDVCDEDDDNDGISDTEDSCPLLENTDQLDTDGDGTGDVCDEDDDSDGILDSEDNCPLTANTDQADINGNGIGDLCDSTTQSIDSLIVYPNPTHGSISIDYPFTTNYFVVVYNMSGKLLMQSENPTTMSIAHLQQGPYLFIIMDTDTGDEIVKKVVLLR